MDADRVRPAFCRTSSLGMRFSVSLVTFYSVSIAVATIIPATHSYNYGEPNSTGVAPSHPSAADGGPMSPNATQVSSSCTTQTGAQSTGTPIRIETHSPTTTEAGSQPFAAGPSVGPQSSGSPSGTSHSSATSEAATQSSSTAQPGPQSSSNPTSDGTPGGGMSTTTAAVVAGTCSVVTTTVTITPEPTQATPQPPPPAPKPTQTTPKPPSPHLSQPIQPQNSHLLHPKQHTPPQKRHLPNLSQHIPHL
ncbi:hypothetical protein P691DRAFT_778806, partial [Macrolepiota fuliginosa MF-IS2]